MENGVFEKQRKQSARLLVIRLVLAALMTAAGVVSFLVPLGVINLAPDEPISALASGKAVKLESADFVDSGLYISKEEGGRPVAYWYFVPVYDAEDYITEVYAVESARDYRAETKREDRPVRTFTGIIKRDDDRKSTVDALVGGDITEEVAQGLLSYNYISRERPQPNSILSMVGMLGALLLIFSVVMLVNGQGLKKRMAAYGVDEFAVGRFERELAQGNVAELSGAAVLTDNWFFHKSPAGAALFPLREIVWLHKKQVRQTVNFVPAGSVFTVEVYFSDGKRLSVPSKKKSVDETMALFMERCPWALAGYSDERARAWAKDKDAIVRASRERADTYNEPEADEPTPEADEPTQEEPIQEEE